MSNFDDKLDYDEEYLDDEEDAQKDKFITFRLGEEEYAIDIIYVTEIIGLQKITQLPDMPGFIKGVINLRGKVIPILDVRRRFRLPEIVYDDRTCIIVVTMLDITMGLVVGQVSEVLDIASENIDPAPKTNKTSQSRYIKGIGKVGDAVKIILNIESVLSSEELEEMKVI